MPTKTKERPILFNGEMVRSILSGAKTQTRRPVKPQPLGFTGRNYIVPNDAPKAWHDYEGPFTDFCPYGLPGDRLWVRETFIDGWPTDCGDLLQYDEDGNELPRHVWYRGDNPWVSNLGAPMEGWTDEDGAFTDHIPWKPSIHMPRWASRITLEVTDVRVERVQSISEADAKAEGITPVTHYANPDSGFYTFNGGLSEYRGPVAAFEALWRSTYGDEPWESDVWVWAITFKRITGGAE